MHTVSEDTKIFTLNVLAAALFSKSYPFESRKESEARVHAYGQDKAFQYRDSLSKILQNIIVIFIFGARGLSSWWMPASWKEAGEAVALYRSYVIGLIADERKHISEGTQNSDDLVSALVRACDPEQHEYDVEKTKRQGSGKKMTLTEEEIISNLFVYAFAGNDTTAVTIAHILINLAANPETQTWIREEIRYYLVSDNIADWKYSLFPKLKRCLAVVMETLRLCHPIGQLVKTTGATPKNLKVGNKEYTIPENTTVQVNLAALQTNPRYWGDDPMTWNPSRFIYLPKDSVDAIENEELLPDTTEHFLPWAYGQRVCPGKKFSQAELVATLATLFRDHRVRPEPEGGETVEDTMRRTLRTGRDIEMKVLYEMKAPWSIGLKWQKC